MPNRMMEIREAGILKRLDSKFNQDSSIKTNNEFTSSDEDDGIKLQHIAPILVIYGIGVILAVLMLMFEHFVVRRTHVQKIKIIGKTNKQKRKFQYIR